MIISTRLAKIASKSVQRFDQHLVHRWTDEHTHTQTDKPKQKYNLSTISWRCRNKKTHTLKHTHIHKHTHTHTHIHTQAYLETFQLVSFCTGSYRFSSISSRPPGYRYGSWLILHGSAAQLVGFSTASWLSKDGVDSMGLWTRCIQAKCEAIEITVEDGPCQYFFSKELKSCFKNTM